MALIGEGSVYAPPKPKFSTKGPLDVPRWEDDYDDGGALSLDSLLQMFQDQSNQSLYMPQTNTPSSVYTPSPAYTLPKLGLGSSADWVGASRSMLQQKKMQEQMQEQIAATPAVVNNTGAAVASGGGGISAYGYKGKTGLDHLRGAAKYGLQTPM